MRAVFFSVLTLLITTSICGCGGADPGSTVEDDRPGGAPSSTISEDPNEVANQMGDDYNGK
ncbi:MAG: hypothetical protein NXI04_13250 [Planctomycetaceae bacterium]|nr:hypothetical protein [Planctomycetaceae bacterium]